MSLPRLAAQLLAVAAVAVGTAAVASQFTGPHPGGTRPPVAVSSETPQLRTDTEPLADAFPKLGTIVQAHWKQQSPTPSENFVHGVLKLAPGTVSRLLATAPGPAEELPGNPYMLPSLDAYLPAKPHWVHHPALDAALLPADFARLTFDAASDTVLLFAIHPADPDPATPQRKTAPPLSAAP
ncbi:hypothetical protein ACWEQL_39200 [Kitasatospora sp. NPDC004240]